jgi:hypothetical protein
MTDVPESPMTKQNRDPRIQELMKKIAHERDPQTCTKWVSELNQLLAAKTGQHRSSTRAPSPAKNNA